MVTKEHKKKETNMHNKMLISHLKIMESMIRNMLFIIESIRGIVCEEENNKKLEELKKELKEFQEQKPKRKPNHPGKILLEHYLKPLDIPLPQFASDIRLTNEYLVGLLEGRERITPHVAKQFAFYFNTTFDFWLNLQANYDKFNPEEEVEITEKR
jgi:antitoxin HigA-1